MKDMDPAERNAQQTYALLYAGQQDLSQAAFYADHLQSKGWYLEPWEGSWQDYLHQAAYVTSMVISYSRPFTESRGWPKFPKRILRVLDTEQKQLHRHLLDLRNEVYAHTDIAARKNRPITLGGQPSAIEVIPPLKCSADELMQVRILIRDISLEIERKLAELAETVAKEHFDADGHPKET
ncbi:MAG: hypothetical protein HND55_00690 [Pseudomonadota bacterium]|nr:MAG: hypothetical protein HND55_00690 [Pseudomonadota bacterium]